jgi:hypothetical protein
VFPVDTMEIEAYRFGYVRINGVEYRRDVIVFPEKVLSDWWREDGHILSLNDLTEVLKYGPGILVIGTGAHGAMKVPQALADELESRGIDVLIAKTDAAVEQFNELTAAKRPAVAALHLTC